MVKQKIKFVQLACFCFTSSSPVYPTTKEQVPLILVSTGIQQVAYLRFFAAFTTVSHVPTPLQVGSMQSIEFSNSFRFA